MNTSLAVLHWFDKAGKQPLPPPDVQGAVLTRGEGSPSFPAVILQKRMLWLRGQTWHCHPAGMAMTAALTTVPVLRGSNK